MSNFFSSLTSKIKSGISSLSSIFSGSKNTASVSDALQTDIGPGFDPKTGIQTQTPNPNMSLITGNLGAADTKGNIVSISSSGKATPFKTAGISQSPTTTKAVQTSIRNALPKNNVQSIIDEATGGKSGGMSKVEAARARTRNSFKSGSSSKRKRARVAPAQSGASGASGEGVSFRGASGGGADFQSTLPQTASGGSSNFSGTLSSVGGLGGQTLQSTLPDEEDRPVEGRNIDVQSTINQFVDPTRNVQSSLNTLKKEQPIGSPSLGNEFTAQDINAGLQASPATRQSLIEYRDQLQQRVLDLRSQLHQNQPTPPEPIEDTPVQLEFIEEAGDPFGIAQAMDDYKRTQTQLVELQGQRMEVIKDIQSINEAYNEVIDDIKENPDLPKGLATRRLQQVYQDNKEIVSSLVNQYELLNQSIDDQNEMVNRAFGLVERAEQASQREQQRRMNLLQLYISSGAIAAFDDNEIQQLGLATGVHTKGLTHIRNRKMEESVRSNLEVRKLDNGDTVVIDMNTGKVASNLGGRKASSPKLPENSTKVLSSVDIQRFSEQYPGVRFFPGDTHADARSKIETHLDSVRADVADDAAGGVSIPELIEAYEGDLFEDEIRQIANSTPVRPVEEEAPQGIFSRLFGKLGF